MTSKYLRRRAMWAGIVACLWGLLIVVELWLAVATAFWWLAVLLVLASCWEAAFVFVLLKARWVSLVEANRLDWQQENLGEEVGS